MDYYADESDSDDDIDHEIVRRNTVCKERMENVRLHIGTMDEPLKPKMASNQLLKTHKPSEHALKDKVSDMISRTRVMKAFEETPIITIDVPEEGETTDYFNPQARPSNVRMGGLGSLSPQHNMTINTDEGMVGDDTEVEPRKDDVEPLTLTKSATSANAGYKRVDTSCFQKAVVRAHAHHKAIDTLRGWMGIGGVHGEDENIKFLREQVRQHRTDVPPLLQAAIIEELLPVIQNISRTYRSYYPTQNNSVGWNLAVVANKTIQILELKLRHLCVKTKNFTHRINHFLNLLGMDANGGHDGRQSSLFDESVLHNDNSGASYSGHPSLARNSTMSRASQSSKVSIVQRSQSRMARRASTNNWGQSGAGFRKHSIFSETKNKMLLQEHEHLGASGSNTFVPKPARSTTQSSGRRTHAKAGLTASQLHVDRSKI